MRYCKLFVKKKAKMAIILCYSRQGHCPTSPVQSSTSDQMSDKRTLHEQFPKVAKKVKNYFCFDNA